ncbi:MAG: hypothetical protein LZF86_130039 [Nitrospira sp.]|nr:MAG: hypothetical protein LZF86_130039 [Nitrospira sp.]
MIAGVSLNESHNTSVRQKRFGPCLLQTCNRHGPNQLSMTLNYVVRMIVGVMNIKSSCFDTLSDLFLNNHPKTGIRDKYGTPCTLLFWVSTNTPPMTMVSPSRTTT